MRTTTRLPLSLPSLLLLSVLAVLAVGSSVVVSSPIAQLRNQLTAEADNVISPLSSSSRRLLTTYTVSGSVTRKTNGAGPYLLDVLVTLKSSTGATVTSAFSNINGAFSFSADVGNAYKLEYSKADFITFTSAPFDIVDADVSGKDASVQSKCRNLVGGTYNANAASCDCVALVVTNGKTVKGAYSGDFCEIAPGSVSGVVRHSSIGRLGSPVAGVALELTDGTNVWKAISSATGVYTFTGLPQQANAAGGYAPYRYTLSLASSVTKWDYRYSPIVFYVKGGATQVFDLEVRTTCSVVTNAAFLPESGVCRCPEGYWGLLCASSTSGSVKVKVTLAGSALAAPLTTVYLGSLSFNPVGYEPENSVNGEGYYEFTGVLPGTYSVLVWTPSGVMGFEGDSQTFVVTVTGGKTTILNVRAISSCNQHGAYFPSLNKCYCNHGYTGQYCQSAPVRLPSSTNIVVKDESGTPLTQGVFLQITPAPLGNTGSNMIQSTGFPDWMLGEFSIGVTYTFTILSPKYVTLKQTIKLVDASSFDALTADAGFQLTPNCNNRGVWDATNSKCINCKLATSGDLCEVLALSDQQGSRVVVMQYFPDNMGSVPIAGLLVKWTHESGLKGSATTDLNGQIYMIGKVAGEYTFELVKANYLLAANAAHTRTSDTLITVDIPFSSSIAKTIYMHTCNGKAAPNYQTPNAVCSCSNFFSGYACEFPPVMLLGRVIDMDGRGVSGLTDVSGAITTSTDGHFAQLVPATTDNTARANYYRGYQVEIVFEDGAGNGDSIQSNPLLPGGFTVNLGDLYLAPLS